MHRRNSLLSLIILAWSGFAVAVYFVAHKPLAIQVAEHLVSLVWTLSVTTILLLNAIFLGRATLKSLRSDTSLDAAALALACGIGLGEMGLLGFVLAALGLSNFLILCTVQLMLLGWFVRTGKLSETVTFIRNSLAEVGEAVALLPRWMKWSAMLTLALTFLMTLLPPVDAFDALLYHLTMPALWIQDGGLRAYNIPHYWFPGLVEGIYFWGLGLGSELVSQQIHFSYALCMMILVWSWTRRIRDDITAGWALMLVVSMPSLFLLASWAYTDLALIFFGLAMLYTLSLGQEQNDRRWWRLSAICAGMAMGVKYTSFVMPLTAILLIALWNIERKKELFAEVLKFVLICVSVGGLWYLRNWIWMGNPIYPFVFGGRYWDDFRSLWFATPGTGSGWDITALLLLPITLTLGNQDINSIDADIGPLLLLAFPLSLRALRRWKDSTTSLKISLTSIFVFSLFSAVFWVYGYITTRDLWQTRLLLPAIIPFIIPMAIGFVSLRELDTRALRLSFIVTIIAALSIYINLLNNGLRVTARNPLAIATGLTTRQSYIEKYQPGYAFAEQAIAQTASNSKIYFLLEPRSYGMTRSSQPDTILDNFSHDLFLYENPEGILQAWQKQGYTHVLLNRRVVGFVLEKKQEQALFDQTMDLLKPVSQSVDGSYELLEIP